MKVRTPIGNARQNREALTAPVGGINTRDFNERISPEQAEVIQNYFLTGDGRLVTREGQTEKETVTGTFPSACTKVTDNFIIYGYISGADSIVAKYDIQNDSSSIVHTYTGSTEKIDIQEYGGYFYFTNGTGLVRYGNVEWLLMTYTGTDPSVGATITGSISGATGVVKNLNAANNTILVDVTSDPAVFQAAEDIGGGATNIVLPESLEIPGAPTGKHLSLYQFSKGTALVVGNIITNADSDSSESLLQWSDFNIDPNEIPFYSWVTATPPTPADAGKFFFRRGGALNSMVSTKSNIIIFYDDATAVFHLDQINVDTNGLSQITVTDHQEYNFGGERGAISTPFGIFYANEKGVWRMQIVGTEKEEIDITSVIDEETIRNSTFTDCEIIFDGQDKIFIFYSKFGASFNNSCIVYDIKNEAIVEITGWNIARATKIQGELYAIDSLSPKIYKLLDGFDDDGNNIDFQVKFKPITFGDPEMRKNLRKFSIKSLLSPSSKLKISFNYWDWQNEVSEGVEVRYQNGKSTSSFPFGVGKTGVGKLNYDEESTAEDLDDDVVKINDFLKVQAVIEESSQAGHEIHYIDFTAIQNKRTIQNSLTKT